MTHRSPAKRLLAIAVALMIPWTVLAFDGGYALTFGFGLLDTNPTRVVSLYDYLFRLTGGPASLPNYLLAWPTSFVLYCGAFVSAVGGFFGREDRRVTGGLLVFAGVAQASVAIGLSQAGQFALPLGTITLWAVAWWFYWPDLRNLLPASSGK